MMKHQYLVISRGKWDETATPKDVQQAIDRFYAWYEGHLVSGRMLEGSRLHMDGKLVTARGVTDGPFAEAKELVGGYWFIVADSLDEAAALAAENPCLDFGLSLEVRPLEQAKAMAKETTNETPDAWRVKAELASS
ncbi:YciI family protein [Hylemonella gracilis]|uniref:DGPFAETKE family protein n=1 Tax=Hylemonella gracilis ATCC 19624 TaxID=887062 RepID=F3KQW4_9BURK|nr:YciI family protein [Hylemonella gracilis]EGI77665.1 DGPFAETKE family protein [Hylemonella gracilis ATCC 19624]